MRDPHVKYLYYTLKIDEKVTYEEPNPISIEIDECKLKLEKEKLICEMIKHYSSVKSAKNAIKDYLKAWEILVVLKFGNKEIEFKYDDAEIIDRNPPEEDTNVISAGAAISSSFSLELETHIKRKNYPTPPKYFRLNPDTNTLWNRYNDYLNGKEKLLAMAYFCLSLIESTAKGRKEASRKYKISKEILNKLGELTTTKGDLSKNARKVTSNSRGPLNNKERKWIESTIKKIILRVGEYENKPTLKKIEMSDLPELE